MKLPIPCRRSENRLLGAALVGVVALSSEAISQTSTPSSGIKFQKAGERSSTIAIRPAWLGNGCDFISHNLEFCGDGTDWVLEGERLHGKQALYRLSDDRRASLLVVPLKKNVSRKLSPDDVAELLERHIFSDGPRGKMKITGAVEDRKTRSGRVSHRSAFVTDTAGKSHLLQVTVSSFDYGLGFLETTIAKPETDQLSPVSKEDFAFHLEFLNKTRVSFSVDVNFGR